VPETKGLTLVEINDAITTKPAGDRSDDPEARTTPKERESASWGESAFEEWGFA
jgi:hypothetical protein